MKYNFKLFEHIKRNYGTQEKYAQAVGVSRPLVSMVLNGRYNLTDNEKVLWAEKAGASVEFLWPDN